ncbi:MAG: 3-phosphoshikimate 1-carboxyvinyltransferase [Omnitrophica WOR_2 bacterium GWF2_38_59]|nr:MAG: 3-phosphoshikimate 1-carboxyvinyltransferase [Omnitrophica WOR_2 bacterium GWF2_38_59]OGX47955.1 MAG: 3-phosphoshikimate 1-carboxyvinyltransferase [Omnitrophica WOR_2 bacterium RIFOXYA2_FULL_38_17]OGX51799.1 MAG: 3-phosphoshikimate 1-carboxyvinyltransferase [Omnitrophica WOR_2 bacterium RIFOXYA12_FULL_38_10]OGX56292.1 MAG: 3-phosphoshikimate 1-carboxyvinyltransferase [Omnitrophica WOR_2 bacterium RIFOXYC2_FULL_38_12]OGX60203.1 MAG: 3-phosphoshikimate 1-carboxyvinyltransferase [Omnitroph
MIVKVNPSQKLKGQIILPASKSYTIRAFIIASCGGVSTIVNSSDCDDAKVSMRVAKALGSGIIRAGDNSWKVSADIDKTLPLNIDVGESGTALRFLLPLASFRGDSVFIEGKGTLQGRPNMFLTQVLRDMGANIKGKGRSESIPIRIKNGYIHTGKIIIDASLSSQFISALIIACPRLLEDTTLLLKGKKIVSSDYIQMTMQVLKKSGIKIEKKDQRKYIIPGNQKFKGLSNFLVPSDYGLAAFTIAAAVLIDSDVVLNGAFCDELVQADAHIVHLIKSMGAKFIKTSASIKIKGPFMLNGGDFNLKDCPDLVPIMSVLALFAKGKTRLYGIKHARVKESDRISDLRKELLKIGAKVEEKNDEIIIYPQAEYKKNCLLDPHNDHRLAMSFAVLGLKLGVAVRDMECCSKSYPKFLTDIKSLGAKFTKNA